MARLMALVLMIDKVSLWAFRLSSILTMILVMITAEQVFARYFFQASSIGLQELEWHLFGCLFLMAGAHTYKIGRHVRVDIVQRLLSPILQTWVERMGILFFLLPCC